MIAELQVTSDNIDRVVLSGVVRLIENDENVHLDVEKHYSIQVHPPSRLVRPEPFPWGEPDRPPCKQMEIG